MAGAEPVPGRRLALLTLDERGDFVIDDELALEPLASLGWDAALVSWRQRARPWHAYAAVIIRSTWDYGDDVDGFMGTLAAIDATTRLANPLGLVRWNLSKTYLRDLERAGVPIVPTRWLARVDRQALAASLAAYGPAGIVVKPMIGANGVDTFRLYGPPGAAAEDEVVACFRHRGALVQPFMARVLDDGEYSLFYFRGQYSHAIRKLPATGEFRSQEEHGAAVAAVTPAAALRRRAAQALAAVRPMPLYARVDLVRDAAADFRVMELELIEPSLYLRTDPAAPARFAQAVDDWLRPAPESEQPAAEPSRVAKEGKRDTKGGAHG